MPAEQTPGPLRPNQLRRNLLCAGRNGGTQDIKQSAAKRIRRQVFFQISGFDYPARLKAPDTAFRNHPSVPFCKQIQSQRLPGLFAAKLQRANTKEGSQSIICNKIPDPLCIPSPLHNHGCIKAQPITNLFFRIGKIVDTEPTETYGVMLGSIFPRQPEHSPVT
ncbi:MAG: hypothetical protein ACK5JO_19080 [Halodesulfovibrio sp.]